MKPSIPDVLEIFKAYHLKHPVWGVLHIVLEDGNVSDKDVVWCFHKAKEEGDDEGVRLCKMLMDMSKTQRRKLGQIA